MTKIILIASLCAGSLAAAELSLPGSAFERDAPITAIFRTAPQAEGKGRLHIVWTDSYGRKVEDRVLPVELRDERELRFTLDMRRAVAMRNEVRVHFSFDGVNKKNEKDHREEDAVAAFIAKPPDKTWQDYQVIMWQGGAAEHFKKLQTVGVNAGKSGERSAALPEALLSQNMRWYAENLATDFYSAYHIYRADRPYNYAFLNARDEYKKNLDGYAGLKRNPSFEDPAWIATVSERIAATARSFSPYRPIFYNLADETGIAELAGFWDFDFSDHSLAAMRRWLQTRYGTLPALNRQWETDFTTWDAVVPDTTRQAMKRANENYSSWADFKEWMDVSFANALRIGVDAVHAVDPDAYVGIEGGQMPGWGGYDYDRLATTLSAIEPYNIGNNVEIIRSINPQLAYVTTAFAEGPWEKLRLWHELLHGARGHIIWDEKNDIVDQSGAIGPRGNDVKDSWTELRAGIGALLIASQRQSDPIAIHYSQAAMRTEWMLQHRNDGDSWIDRMSWHERKDSPFLSLRNSYCHLLEDLGLQYNFVSYRQVEEGDLLKGGYRVLILPRSSALSPLEAAQIRAFVQQGGSLIYDGIPGTFDEHSRRLTTPQLAGVPMQPFDALAYGQQRILGKGNETRTAMQRLLSAIHPAFFASVPGLEVQEFRNGGISIVGLVNNPQMEIDDLGQPNPDSALKSKKEFEKPYAAHLTAPAELYAYDMRQAKSLGRVKELNLTVDPYEPTLIAFSPYPIPELKLSIPEKLERGSSTVATFGYDGPIAAAHAVFHVEVRNPSGEFIDYYSGNVVSSGASASKSLPIAQDAAPGRWTIRVKELLSGRAISRSFEIF